MKNKKKKHKKSEKKPQEVLLSTKMGLTKMIVRLNVDYNIADPDYL